MTIIVPAKPQRPIVVEGQAAPSFTVTGGRTLPPGGAAGQALVKDSDSDFATRWSDIIASASWGAITGTLSDQTDLQSALDAKQGALVSGVSIKTLNGSTILGSGDLVISASAAWGGITGTLSAQTDLQTALDARQPLATVLTNTTASFTTAQETKLSGITTGATANATDAALRDRATHTGTQAVGTITGLSALATSTDAANLTGTLAAARLPALTGAITSAAGSAATALGSFTKAQLNAAVSDGDPLYVGDVTTNATHTGDVTGSTALTIANDAVTNAKLANMATATIKGRTAAGTGDPEDLTPAQARTVIEVPKITVGTTAPGSPSVGDVWIDTN